jgi:hypothetical protein
MMNIDTIGSMRPRSSTLSVPLRRFEKGGGISDNVVSAFTEKMGGFLNSYYEIYISKGVRAEEQ